MRRLALLLPLIAVATLHATDPTLPPLVFDQGAAGAWQKILKLQTTASVLHTTAHPDDEHSGVLTMLSRGLGARTALLTINRGEAGDNAIGAGAVRRPRLDPDRRARARRAVLRPGRAVLHAGGRLRLLEASRRGDDRVGPRAAAARHGARHPAIPPARRRLALARQRARRAWPASGRRRDHADRRSPRRRIRRSSRSLASEQLRPWRVRKLYAGGAREAEPWHVRWRPARTIPVLGDSYNNVGRAGLSLQRSQTSGRLNLTTGPAPVFYTRVRRRRDEREGVVAV